MNLAGFDRGIDVVSFACALLVIGLGLILYVSDMFGYSKSVKAERSRLMSAQMLTREQRDKRRYYQWAGAARVVGWIAIAVGLLLLIFR